MLELSGLVTMAVRQVVPLAREKGLVFSFDCRGPQPTLSEDPIALQCGLHRMLCAAVDLVGSGFIVFDVRIDRRTGDRHRLCVTAAGTGVLAEDAEADEVLRRLDLHVTVVLSPADRVPVRRAYGRCPRTGARVEYASVRDEGLLLRFDHEVACADAPEAPLPEAQQARAWVIDEDDAGRESLVKRLQRLGWATTTFGSLDAGEQRLRTMPAAQARPALVVATESRSASPSALRRFVPLLPTRAQCVLAVASGSPALAHAPPDIEVQVLPFSPSDILRWTARLSGEADLPSGLTRPAPLTLTDRPRVLVVDDNEVNRIVATALSESLGYEVHLAHDGADAIQACRRAPPVAVLMDLSMPRMDGFEAAQRLRALQRRGDIPPFSIIAATADCTADTRHRCLAAGMDGYLAKPLLLPALAAELRRLCAGSVLAA